MIKDRKELRYYIDQDRKANKYNPGSKQKIMHFFFPDHIILFLTRLRKCEYLGKKRGPINKLLYAYHKIRLKSISIKLGFSIPEHVFGPGLAIPHYGTIVVNPKAKVGANCRIHVCTNIGASGGSAAAPQIGDNVYIGPGAKLYGDIVIGNNNAIAANAAVNKSFTEEGVVIGGVPGKVIGELGDIKKLIKHI
ncbi:serine acetyltransferase [Flavobacterium sp.]|uniref:serine acetyltransferase n=1 Tax=Flavobacterium sp. TaxID=239 RepID=UPI00403406C9